MTLKKEIADDDLQKDLERKFKQLFGSFDENPETKEELELKQHQENLNNQLKKIFGSLDVEDSTDENQQSILISNQLSKQLQTQYEQNRNKAWKQYGLSNYQKSLDLWMQNLDIAIQLIDQNKEMACYYEICKQNYHLENFKEALYYSFKITSYSGVATHLLLYKSIYRQFIIANRIVLARFDQEKILKLLNTINKQHKLGKNSTCLLEESYWYLDLVDPIKALSKAQRALNIRLSENQGNHVSGYYRQCIRGYCLCGNLKQAIITYDTMIKNATSQKGFVTQSILKSEVILSFTKKDYLLAFSKQKELLTFCKQHNNDILTALYHLITIGAIANQIDDLKEYIIELIRTYRTTKKKYDSDWNRLYIYRALGHYYCALSYQTKNEYDYKKANHYYQKAKETAKRIDIKLCINEGWEMKIDRDLAHLENHELPWCYIDER